MSPTEQDLRAALHDGEGAGVDADRLIAGGQARRAQRRVRVLSGAAAAVVVAAAGVGSSVLIGGGTNDDSGASHAGDASQAQQNQYARPTGAAGSDQAAAGGAGRGATSSVACPASLPRYLLPGGGSAGQFGADGPLFAKPVRALVVCAYGTTLQALAPSNLPVPARLELTGDRAARLVVSLEGAPKLGGSGGNCTPEASRQRHLALLAVASDGSRLPAVTATIGGPACAVQVTNGTAARSGWTPPADLAPVLTALTPRRQPEPGVTLNHTPPGKVHGSPIHS